MTSKRVDWTWIRTGGYRRFRGEWVKHKMTYLYKGKGFKNEVWGAEGNVKSEVDSFMDTET